MQIGRVVGVDVDGILAETQCRTVQLNEYRLWRTPWVPHFAKDEEVMHFYLNEFRPKARLWQVSGSISGLELRSLNLGVDAANQMRLQIERRVLIELLTRFFEEGL